jgi:dihydrolipoamide dehydrogenase
MTEEIYDVIVLGAGAGGTPAAIRAAQLGGRVAIIECGSLGGFCVNRGCIPFGQMMVASNILGGISLGKAMGLDFSGISRDYPALIKRQNELIALMREGASGMLKKNRVEIIEGRARIAGKGKVEVNGKTIPCKNIILATGAKWLKPDFPGADLEEVINSDYLLNTDKLPKRVLLFGTSPWLIEIAQFLHRFGSLIILATRDKTILSDESETIISRLTQVLKREGISIKTQGEIVAATKKKGGVHVDLSSKDGHETVVVDRVINIERAASLKDLGLKRINLDEEGPYLRVNSKMETGIEGVYAIGDLTGPQSRHYSHLAAEQGIIAAENTMGQDASINPRTFTRVVFTQPQIACIGLTPKEAENAGYDVVVGEAPYGMNPFGMIISENLGTVEVVSERRYGEVLGVHFIGKDASEMAGQAVLAIQMEATIEELSKTSFPHLTLSESLAEAARDALGKPIYLP